MGRRLLDLLAMGSILLALVAAGVWLRGRFYSDVVVVLAGRTCIRLESLPGKLRMEYTPGWPYPAELARGWTSWRYTKEFPAPVLDAGATNVLGFGFEKVITIVVSNEEPPDEWTPAPSVAVQEYVLIVPILAIIMAAGVLPAMRINRRLRRKVASVQADQPAGG